MLCDRRSKEITSAGASAIAVVRSLRATPVLLVNDDVLDMKSQSRQVVVRNEKRDPDDRVPNMSDVDTSR